jgi:ATP-binding cassette subfamily B protein
MQYMNGEIEKIGTIAEFIIYVNMLTWPVATVGWVTSLVQQAEASQQRINEFLKTEPEIKNTAKELTPIKGDIEFKNVSFAYLENEYVLKNLSFTIEAGQTLAIVGSTGSGKSTIINILSRFYETQKGTIEIDGINIRDYKLQALRNRLAVVLQDVFLFTGTVYDNITLRDDRITKEQVLEAAKLIGAHEFIEKLPGGYNYDVMERGSTLSMGQRQLISFVRALVFNPDILILDEATSSIDSETESVIQYAIEKLIAKRTSIIIAHRLSTIRHADNILVLDKGRILEYGSHETLLKIEGGHYRELYEMQFLQVEQ